MQKGTRITFLQRASLKLTIGTVIIFSFGFTNFSKKSIRKEIIGFWHMEMESEAQEDETIYGHFVFAKCKKVIENENYYHFTKNGKFIHRKQTSFCGTGSIEFTTIHGTCNQSSDSTVRINFDDEEKSESNCIVSRSESGRVLLKHI